MGLLDGGYGRILEPGMPLHIVHVQARIWDPREQPVDEGLETLRKVPSRLVARVEIPEFVILTRPQVAVPLVVREGTAEGRVARIEDEEDHTCCEEVP